MYFVAEIGVNHNGNIELAKEMIDAAKNCGADCVKFQSFKANKLAMHDTPKVEYQKCNNDDNESHFEMLSRLEITNYDMVEIYNYCIKKNIDFISTPYDVESAKDLFELGCRTFKTASADIIDYKLHKYLATISHHTIISVGMASLGEIESVLSIYKNSSSKITLLHCVSNYPCSDNSVNMKVIDTLKSSFGVNVGFSDHTIGSVAAILSISFGATFIEKHFTLDKTLPGPDHSASSTPSEFKELVTSCKRAQVMLGDSIKSIQKEEISMREISRKSIYASENINKGDLITSQKLDVIRPGGGLSPMLIPTIDGSIALRNITKGELLRYGDFGD